MSSATPTQQHLQLEYKPKMKAVDFQEPGGPDVLHVREVPIPRIKDDEVMIEVAATGVNRLDIWARRGSILSELPYIGYECSGKIVGIGSNVHSFREGDKVCAILRGGGGYAELVAVRATHVKRIPSGISLVEAAALPQATCLTVYIFLVLVGLTPGKTILIHGAAGGFGLIALQYSKYVGCEVIAVAGTEEKLKLCKMLGAKACINYRTEDFLERVKAETGGKGVDIILDVNGRDHFKNNLDCLAMGGSLVTLGYKSGLGVDLDLSFLKNKDIDVLGADLENLDPIETSWLMSKIETEIWPLIENGHIKPVIGKIFSFSAAKDAHISMEEYSVAGKVVLVPRESKC